MALIQKDENDNLVTLAAKSNPIAFYATDQAAQDAYDNGEIPEGTIVFTEEDATFNKLGDIETLTLSNSTSTPTVMNKSGFITVTCSFADYLDNKRQTMLWINNTVFNVCSLDSTSHTYTVNQASFTMPVKVGDSVACYGKSGSGSNPGESTIVYFREFNFM